MSSLRRITASRANPAHSRGPITPDGKERSSANVHSSWFPGIGEMAAVYWRMRCAPAAAPPNHAVPNETSMTVAPVTPADENDGSGNINIG
jgi:hypothetical protein